MKFTNINVFENKPLFPQDIVISMINKLVDHLGIEVKECTFVMNDVSSILYYFENITSDIGRISYNIAKEEIEIQYNYKSKDDNEINNYMNKIVHSLKTITHGNESFLSYLVLFEKSGFEYKVVVFGNTYTLTAYIKDEDIENSNFDTLKRIFSKKNFGKEKFIDYTTAELLFESFDSIVTLEEASNI